MGNPLVRVVNRDGRFEITGSPSVSLGHKLQISPNGTPDGIFAEWSWDGSRLLVRSDRYGFYPLYYFVRKGEVCVSTSILELLAQGAPADINEAGFSVFLRLGFFIGEDTPFRAIRAVPPNARFIWRDDFLEASGTYARGRHQSLKRDGAIDAYIYLFRAAIERRLPTSEDFTVPISGGRDSRHILLELCAAGHRPKFCLTLPRFPPGEADDVEVASMLAQAVGIRHVVLTQARSRLKAELRKNLQTNFCADENAWYLPMVDYLKGRVSLLYDGIGGDVLSESRNLSAERMELFDSGRFTDLAQHMFVRNETGLARLLQPQFYRRCGRDLAVDQMVAELKKHVDAPNPIGSFYFWSRTRREIALAPYALLNSVAEVYSPFLDHDLFDFLTSLPATMLLDRQFHTETIRRAHPRVARIPFESRATLGGMYRSHFRRLALELGWYTLRHTPSPIVRTSLLLPRLVLGILNGDHMKMGAAAHPLVPYLIQLGNVLGEGPRIPWGQSSLA